MVPVPYAIRSAEAPAVFVGVSVSDRFLEHAPVAQLDRASASGADPTLAKSPRNPVFIEQNVIQTGPNRSENGWQNTKRLAVRLAVAGQRSDLLRVAGFGVRGEDDTGGG